MGKIYGISGKIGQGKDTVGLIIQYLSYLKEHNLGQRQLSFEDFTKNPSMHTLGGYNIKKFAYKLKQIVALLTGCTIEQLEDQEFKNQYLPEEWNYAISGLRDKMPISHFKGDVVFEGNPNRFTKRYTYRDLLQQIGTECMRNGIHQNVWVNALFSDYKCSCGDSMTEGEIQHVEFEGCNPPNWIITDCRFPNEAKAIKERGGILIRVERPLTLAKAYLKFVNPKADGAELHNFCSQYQTIVINRETEVLNNKGYFDGMNKIRQMATITAEEHPSETSLDGYEFDHVIDNNGTIDDLIEKVAKILGEHAGR